MSFFPTQGNGIFGQGSFTIDQNSTPEMIKAKRAQIAALMPQYGKAKYVGEGFGQLFQGIATGKKNRELDKFEGERRQEAAGQFNGIMSGGGSRPSGPLSVLGMRPDGAAQAPGPDQQIADDTMNAIGKPKQGGDREAFIQEMMPHAQRVAQQTGLDPRLIIAQAAQETGWGKSAPGNNYFGIKSHGQAGGNNLATNEVINGETVRMNQSFRGYEGMGDSVDGYAEFLQKNPRYKQMLGAGDLDGQLAALGASGYATDPNYASSVGSIARSIQVPQGSFAPGQGQQVAQNGGGYQPPQNDGRLNELMMAAQNPWLSPQQRGVINAQIQQVQGQQQAMQERQYRRDDAVFGQQLSQQDPMYQLNLQKAQRELNAAPDRKTIQGQDGRNYYIDTGEPVLPNVGPKPVDPTTSQRDYDYYAKQETEAGRAPLSFNQWDLQGKKAGANNNTLTVGGESTMGVDEEELRKKLGGKEGEAWSSYMDAGAKSAGVMQDMELLDEIITMAPQGPVTGRLANAFTGVNSAADAFNSVVKRVAPTLRAEGSGSTSDIEYEGMLRSLPQLSSRPEANTAISAMMKAKAQINMERAQIVRDYQNEEITAKGARRKMSELDGRSIMTPDLRAILTGLDPSKGNANGDAEFLRSLGLE